MNETFLFSSFLKPLFYDDNNNKSEDRVFLVLLNYALGSDMLNLSLTFNFLLKDHNLMSLWSRPLSNFFIQKQASKKGSVSASEGLTSALTNARFNFLALVFHFSKGFHSSTDFLFDNQLIYFKVF